MHFRDGSNAYGAQWYDRVPDLASASSVKVEELTDDIAGVDAVLDTATQISGTVTSEIDGKPLEGICVGAFDPSSTSFNGNAISETQTAADGTYTLGGLASTPYLVLFRDCEKLPTYALEFYDGGAGTADPAEATPVTPTGRGADDIDGALGLGGTITGTVYQLPDETPLEGRCVLVISPGFGLVAITQTAADGTYTLAGIPAGQWYVASGNCDAKDEDSVFVWYAGATSVPVDVAEDDDDPVTDGAKLVTVVAGATTTGINLYFGTPTGGSTTPTDPAASGTDPADAANAGTSSGSLPRTGVPGPDMAILGGLLLGLGLLVVRISEVRRAR